MIENDRNKLSHVNEGEATGANITGASSCRDIRTPGLENASDSGKDKHPKYIKCVTLNVAGFHNKLELGILDKYLSEFDICLVETNTDSPHLDKSLLSDFLCISCEKIK